MTGRIQTQVDALVEAVTASEEYRRFAAARKQVEEREAARIMLRDLRTLQGEIEAKQAAGEPVGEDMLKQWEQRLQIVSYNPYVREYLEAEFTFARLVADVQKRLLEGLGLLAAASGDSSDSSAPVDSSTKAGSGGAAGAETPDAAAGGRSGGTDGPRIATAKSRLWVPGQP